MFNSRHYRSLLLPLAIFCIYSTRVFGAGADTPLEEEVIIEMDDAEEILIEETPGSGATTEDDLIIEDSSSENQEEVVVVDDEPPDPASTWADEQRFEIGIDDAWVEYGHFVRSDSEADDSAYGKIAASANWQPNETWEVQVAARVDGYGQYGGNSVSDIRADYGDSFVRYRAENLKFTLGTQTVVWGRLDELPLSDRVSTADLTRFNLDDLEDRRRSSPMVRAETFIGSGKLDMVWLYSFRGAVLPDKDSVWYPINRTTGRVIGFDPKDIPPTGVRNAKISDDASNGDGGFGARYTRTHSFADIGVTVANTRQSTPYYRTAGPNHIEAVYPRSWAYGADAAIDAAGATWRIEVLYSHDNPVTRSDLGYTTTPAIAWGGGVEFHPGDGDARVNLQLVGTNLIDAPSTVIDREHIYSLNGKIESPFDRDRWRAKLKFYLGLGDKDVYLNPEIAFLGWEPHEVYLAGHYFDGNVDTFGGFHKDHSSINLGWRSKF